MADRDRQLQRDVGVDVDVPRESVEDSRRSNATGGDRLGTRVRSRAGKFVSGRALVLSLVLVVVGILLVGGALPLGTLGDLFGIVVAAFLYGVAAEARHYVETALAGAVAGGGSALLGNLVLSLLGAGIPMVALGAVAGALAALLGHYLGRDLRDGLTRDL